MKTTIMLPSCLRVAASACQPQCEDYHHAPAILCFHKIQPWYRTMTMTIMLPPCRPSAISVWQLYDEDANYAFVCLYSKNFIRALCCHSLWAVKKPGYFSPSHGRVRISVLARLRSLSTAVTPSFAHWLRDLVFHSMYLSVPSATTSVLAPG